MHSVIENVAVFGQFGGLVGIISEPADGAMCREFSERDRPAIIVLNTGMIHRVGAARLNTIWARRMAHAGHCVLRFDLSGVGDSERREDGLPPVEMAMADLRDAVDWLQSARGMRRVVVIGNCFGANLALLYAGTDDRVVGMVIIDPSTPPTWVHHLRKFLTIDLWKRKLKLNLTRLSFRRERSRESVYNDVWKNDDLPLNHPRVHATLADAYQAAFARKVETLAIFTTGAAWYNYRNQLFDAFPEIHFDGKLQLEYFERCDHTITHEVNRTRLFEVVDSWLEGSVFKAPIAAAEPSEPTPPPCRAGAGSSDLISVEF